MRSGRRLVPRLVSPALVALPLVALGACDHAPPKSTPTTPSSERSDDATLALDDFKLQGFDDDVGDEGDAIPLAEAAYGNIGHDGRHCVAHVDGSVTVDYDGHPSLDADLEGALDEDAADERGHVWRYDLWHAGASFGANDPSHPNTGYTAADGSVVNGAPRGAQPAKLACSSNAYALVGWRFSNNVTSLALTEKVRSLKVATDADGNRRLVRIKGTRYAVYQDPSASSAAAYFDEAAGAFTAQRLYGIGDPHHPNLVAVVSRDADGHRIQRYELTTDDRAPIVERTVRHLPSPWTRVERTLASGTFVQRFFDGATTRTTVSDVAFHGDASGMSCRPDHGTLTIAIQARVADDAAQQQQQQGSPDRWQTYTIERTYANGALASVKTSCAPDVSGCSAAARSALETYGPQPCLY
jgi:hypothetical protein